MEKTFETKFGTVTVRTAVFEDPNGIDLYDGIEIKGEYIGLIEVPQYYDVDELEIEKVENLIESIE